MSERRDRTPAARGNRFVKGQSGNPKGRPRKAAPTPTTSPSAFDLILDRNLLVVQGSEARDVTIEEALQLKTYQQAIAGSRLACRAILKMIQKRDAARNRRSMATRAPSKLIPLLAQHIDPSNADAAMLILDIARHDPSRDELTRDRAQLLLEPWAVQAALGRRRWGQALTASEQAEITRCTRAADQLRWPRGSRK